MAPRPRVLMVSARFPPDLGGVETHVAEVAPRLAGLDFDVSVLTTDPSGLRPEVETHAGVEVRRVRAYPSSRDYYFAPALAGIIRSSRADLVHLQGYHTLVAPVTMAAAASARIPYVVSFHSGGHRSVIRQRLRSVQRLALRPWFRRAARLIAVSRYELEVFSGELGLARRRFALVRNGSTLPAPRGPRSRRPYLVMSVGRLERFKGHHRLVEAWPAVRGVVPPARLRILGSGPDEESLRRRIDELGLREAIEVGNIPAGNRQEMADALRQAALVALLSDYEAHPVAVMEALGVGTPVLVTRTSGLSELVDDGLAAGLAADADAAEIARSVVHELQNPRAVDVGALPTWDDCAAQLREVYLQAIGGA